MADNALEVSLRGLSVLRESRYFLENRGLTVELESLALTTVKETILAERGELKQEEK